MTLTPFCPFEELRAFILASTRKPKSRPPVRRQSEAPHLIEVNPASSFCSPLFASASIAVSTAYCAAVGLA